ncbi:MAG: cytochrome c peroxidase [bacterium]
MKRNLLKLVSILLLTLAFAGIPSVRAKADVVVDWNDISLQSIQEGLFVSTKASRALAMVHLAVFEAVTAARGGEGDPECSMEAAAVAAAARVLISLFPSQAADLSALADSYLAAIPDGQDKTDGIALGQAKADEIILWRSTDHSGEMVPYVPGDQPGDWRPTPPMYQPAMMPNWAIVTPFAMTSNSQFRSPPPPLLGSARYAAALNEVKELGSLNSSIRKPEQTEIAMFWADSPGTVTTAGRWNLIARDAAQHWGNTLEENALLFALLNVTLADAGIAAWDTKYTFNLWRPVTAIQEADTDGNPRTEADPSWMPLLMTPAFPEYNSAHSTFSAAAAQMLILFFATDRFEYSIESYSQPGTYRTYHRFSEAAEEAGISRIYGGIHYSFSNVSALRAGRRLARWVWDEFDTLYGGAEEELTPEQRLGKLIFFDQNLSRPHGQSCASCHDPLAGFADPDADLPVSEGAIPGRFGNRNAQSVSYAMFSPPMYFDPTTTPAIPEGKYVGGLFWDGRADTLEDQAKQPFLNPLEMHNPNKATVVHEVRLSAYELLFRQVFGAAALKDADTAYACVAQALAAYMRSAQVNPFTSKYDYWKKGEAPFTEAEERGYLLFTGMERGRCFNCHSEPYFTNFGHQNLGTPRNPDLPYYDLPPSLNPDGENYIDRGLGDFLRSKGLPEEEAAKEDGKLKIPSLRNCAVTAPYTHNGYHQTLREVVVFNNTRDLPEAGWPEAEVPETVHRHPMAMPGTLGRLGLTDQEIDDIVAFLMTLTDGYQLE